jgi:SPP1 gp7 family putative phage head morphogenesis protein
MAKDKDKDKKSPWEKPQSVVKRYEKDLRKVAREVGRIIEGFRIEAPGDLVKLQDILKKYAEVLEPWAKRKAQEIIAHADRQDRRAWAAETKEASVALREEIKSAPVGQAARDWVSLQVTLITSLPIDAGNRVHDLVWEAMADSGRAKEIAKEIARSGEVTESRAMLIARTEVGRASTALTMARAQHIGAETYKWVTAGDSRVRPMHRKLNGRHFSWDNPPECDPGIHAHPGAVFNCRCYAAPDVPETIT